MFLMKATFQDDAGVKAPDDEWSMHEELPEAKRALDDIIDTMAVNEVVTVKIGRLDF